MKKNIIKISCFFIFLFVQSAFAWQRSALISPIRVVIDKKKTANVKIINTTDLPTTYKIEIISMEMDKNGVQYSPATLKPHAQKAINMLKYSPRRITLKPGEIQTIRIMARKHANIPKGEYRCHLKVTPLPPAPEQNNEKDKSSINVDINYLISTTIPIIVRHGEISKNIKVKNIDYLDNLAVVNMERTGKKSGLFSVEISQNNSVIGKIERTAFYYPNKKLTVKIMLNSPLIKGKKIEVKLIDLESDNKQILDIFSTII